MDEAREKLEKDIRHWIDVSKSMWFKGPRYIERHGDEHERCQERLKSLSAEYYAHTGKHCSVEKQRK